jgi:hypothetical protein
MNTATKAVGLFNWDTNHTATVSFTAADANLPANQQFVVYNCWSNAVAGFLTNAPFSVSMSGGTVQLFKLYPRNLFATVSSFGISNGQFSLQARCNAGPDYAVQVSSNLQDWQTVFTTNSPLKPVRWKDTSGTASSARFYRVKVGPPLP